MSVRNHVGVWIALITVAAIALPGIASAQYFTGGQTRDATITLGRDPEPPNCAGPQDTVSMFWLITHSTTPNFVTYELRDPSDTVVDSANYPGTSGLDIQREWYVPLNPDEGTYWIRIEYHSYEAGHEATAEVSLWVCAITGQIRIQKVRDADCNGVISAGDAAVGGWWVCLEDADMQTFCMQTNASGVALWASLPLGDYTVYEMTPLPPGWIPIGSMSHDIALTPENSTAVRPFLNQNYDDCYGACCLCDGECVDTGDGPFGKYMTRKYCEKESQGEFFPGKHCGDIVCGAPSARDQKSWGQIKGTFRKKR